ncbi:CDP-alcohol phosphatidyltransferase family protein [Amycolatopsis echigonensis]|uniref:CDP-alcohol phosphatidyltransferase family protein n=1 Tax=Amycolatopsis echigonensis TaxID=2576905 RepID=A0A8E1W4S6_9PSEU|nr:CDP-alcohol phosphatidyltransferase family protein [Amycolatopsis echigonensis]
MLAGLRAGRWGLPAWARFVALSTRRSVHQARRRPRALVEVTALHVVFALLAGRRGRRWTAVSWALAASHLGMLEGRRSLGVPNVITLLRANLPVLGGPVRWLGVVALASDLLDGRLARRTGTQTAFGGYADSLADAVFWTWFVARHERDRSVRVAALAVWVVPVVIVTVASVAGGQMVDAPRPVLWRPAAAMQAMIAVRAVLRPAQLSGSSAVCSSASPKARSRSTASVVGGWRWARAFLMAR